MKIKVEQRKLTLQHRAWDYEFDCANSADQQTTNALEMVERAVNEAIEAGATRVKIQYPNIRDAERNPDGDVGRVRVIGYRTLAEPWKEI